MKESVPLHLRGVDVSNMCTYCVGPTDPQIDKRIEFPPNQGKCAIIILTLCQDARYQVRLFSSATCRHRASSITTTVICAIEVCGEFQDIDNCYWR